MRNVTKPLYGIKNKHEAFNQYLWISAGLDTSFSILIPPRKKLPKAYIEGLVNYWQNTENTHERITLCIALKVQLKNRAEQMEIFDIFFS